MPKKEVFEVVINREVYDSVSVYIRATTPEKAKEKAVKLIDEEELFWDDGSVVFKLSNCDIVNPEILPDIVDEEDIKEV